MRHSLLVVLALSLAVPAGAQEPPLSLRRALELARLHSPLLPVAAGRLRVAEGVARERAVPANPILEIRQENVNGAQPVDRFTTLALPLDLTFRRAALREVGRGQVAAALADSATTAREVDAAVATLYWRSALADALEAAAAREAEVMEEIAALEAAQLAEGVVAEGVVLRTRLEVERTRLALAQARAGAQRAHATLAQAIGLPPEEVAHPGPAQLPAAAALPAPGAALAQALLARPELEAARRRVEAARWGVTAGRRAALPGVALQIGARQTGGRTGGIVALSVEVPLRDAGQAARARAGGELALAEAELAAATRRVEAEVAAGLDTYRRLREALPPDVAELAERGAEVAAIARTAYREGAITLVELLDAQRAHTGARVAAATWQAEVAAALIEVHRALGAPIVEGL